MEYDLVIPLGVGSIWHDNEVKYCIRSFVKYFKQLGKVYIVGHKPNFFNWNNPRLVHISSDDPYKHSKDANIILKVLKACLTKDLSNDFIRCSDDQFVITDVDVDDFYPRYLLDLKDAIFPAKSRWRIRLMNTIDMLRLEGKTSYHYESHFPMLYNKQSFLNVVDKHLNDRENYTINTLYFNSVLDEHKQLGDIKLTLQRAVPEIRDMLRAIKNKKFIGYNNKGLREGVLKMWIQQTFSEKSEFEM